MNRLISDGERCYGVVVNEFGDVVVDAALIERLESEGVAELEGGCVCCVGREDLAVALHGLVEREEPPEYILVELSGLADPVPVAQMLLTTEFRTLLELDGIVAVADARNLERTVEDSPEGRAQLAYTSVVVLNKTDLADDATLSLARDVVAEINPLAPLVPASHARVSRPAVIGLDAFENGPAPVGRPAAHDPAVRSFTLHSEAPQRQDRWAGFRNGLLLRRPASVYRTEGLLYFEGAQEPYVFQSVRGICSLESARGPALPGDPDGASRLVVIGASLDEERYHRAFARLSGDPAAHG